MALVIGRRASNVSWQTRWKALCSADGQFHRRSARDLPPAGNTFYPDEVSRYLWGRWAPTSSPPTRSAYPHHVQIRLWVNGALKQDFNTGDMAHKIPRCIEWVSAIHTLNPGDVARHRTQPPGASPRSRTATGSELEVEGLGRHARESPRRVEAHLGARDTRLEHEQKGLPGRTPQLSGKYAKNPQ